MNRDQKAAAIAQIAEHIRESSAVFAVDYQGISVPQAKLRDADATFKVVKNSLTERAADAAEVEELKALLQGPTALTFVRGDAATAAKALADYGRATQLLPFKGGLMDGAALDPEQIRAISRLPSREVLYGQLVGVIASPVSGLVRTLNALLGGLAVALGQVQTKKESGQIPAGPPPAAAEEAPEAPEAEAAPEEETAPEAEAAPEAPGGETAPEGESAATAETEAAPEGEATPEAGSAPEAQGAPEVEIAPEEEAAPEAETASEAESAPEGEATPEAAEPDAQAEPEQAEPAQDDNQADVSAQAEPEDAETTPTPKED
jgi:large subunit ribosomal protein L10